MNRLRLSTFALLAATTPAVCTNAQTWTESNADNLPVSAEVPIGNGVLKRIDGNLSSLADVDMYLIDVHDPASFRCSTVGGATFDTQLWMFDLNGIGISFNDDVPTSFQSTLTGQFLTGPGRVLIAVSRFGVDALDSAQRELWRDTPFAVERQPDGLGAANPVVAWNQPATGTGGTYSLFLTGASFALSQSDEPSVAWTWVFPPASLPAIFEPNTTYQYTPSGIPIRVARLGVGTYRVDIPGIAPTESVPQACPFGIGGHSVAIDDWLPNGGGTSVFVRVNSTAGALVDSPFDLHFRHGGADSRREAFVLAHNASVASYTPSPNYSWNGSRPDPTIVRTAVGRYRVTLPGLASAGPEFGHVQVTPYTGPSSTIHRRASVISWGHMLGNVDVNVETFDGAGNNVDAMFVMSYNESAAPIAEHLGSGAHVLTNQPTVAGPYTPPAAYTDSNGTTGPANAETVTRTSVGRYQVRLPNVVPSHSAIAQVTARGSNTFASVLQWAASGTGTVVEVQTLSASGLAADSNFCLLYLTNRPAGTAATSRSYGTACHGLALVGLTRPVLGSAWELQLAGVGPGASLGIVSLGFANPNQSIGPLGAPGCTGYVNPLANIFVLLPATVPAYAVNVPPSTAFLGVQVLSQGIVLDQTLNALGAAFSAGLNGTIGDV